MVKLLIVVYFVLVITGDPFLRISQNLKSQYGIFPGFQCAHYGLCLTGPSTKHCRLSFPLSCPDLEASPSPED